jgi:hypothetical protein
VPDLNFVWNGEPIPDIEVWASQRGEKMVRVRKTWTEPMPLAGKMVEREEVLIMPACFANGLRFGGPRNENYTVIGDA